MDIPHEVAGEFVVVVGMLETEVYAVAIDVGTLDDDGSDVVDAINAELVVRGTAEQEISQ